jgi:hypothetical protein
MAIFDDYFGDYSPRLRLATDYNFAVIAFPSAICSTVIFWTYYVVSPKVVPNELFAVVIIR